MSYRFLRSYQLVIGKKGQKEGIVIEPPMRIAFDIEKDSENKPNENTIKIYNLAPTTRQAVEQPDMRCVLYAGYEQEGNILLCSGDIATAYSYHDNADWVTELYVLDGLIEIRDTAVSLGYQGGVSSTQIVNDIATKMGVPLVGADSLKSRLWANGFSFYGAARTALDKVVAGTGLEWSIQNGELQIVNRKGVTKRTGYVLAKDSGLIGFPERTREAARSKKQDTPNKKQEEKFAFDRQARDGWNVKSLLLPMVNPCDKIKLESQTITNWFRVEKIKHSGDSHSGDWQSELHLIDLNAPTKAEQKAQRKHRKKRKKAEEQNA
ncbi:phage protein [Avibacterium paragallinarum]|uniref:Uncharacterized protein n=1 Tax=Avibacterium paragallinarum TaxID=728 RepID=A0A377IAM3_AVIPA|nr:hypothetical protein [Avibacterium paragallinarum]POY46505.1 hypothetical protein C3364_07100 [Avibacterium paragallinarum]RZN57446.1 hypothetical protein EIG78_06945 [Avibacterium paragallinarum]RZN77802.1 hypothetical protein EC523_01455 [Avibacterium paragallinarum]STO72221.1 Uncharacterised protein [Avibacterium paragallinarum]